MLSLSKGSSWRLFGAQKAYVGCVAAHLRAAYGKIGTMVLTWQECYLSLGQYLDAFAPKSCAGASKAI